MEALDPEDIPRQAFVVDVGFPDCHSGLLLLHQVSIFNHQKILNPG